MRNKNPKKLLLSLILATGLLHNASAAQVEKSDLAISSIQLGKMDQDTLPAEFSMVINFKNTASTLAQWKFGFYMPRSFYSLAAQQINPKIEMQVCESGGGKCSNLRYLKVSAVSIPDLSNGYFTMLEPLSSFPLEEQKNYYIRLSHNNQWGVGNVSALPQSFFVISDDKTKDGIPRIFTLNSELNQYTLQDYDQAKVDQQLSEHLSNNWQQSQAVDTPLIKLVPSPVSIQAGFDNGYTIPKTLVIHNQLNSDNGVANLWAPLLKASWQLKKAPLVDNNQAANDGIVIVPLSDPKTVNNSPEGYRLTIANNNITIEAMTPAGVYYAFQSLRQISAQASGGNLPSLIVADYPRFKYRGVLLDVARHYFSVNEIKCLLDVMATQKLNTLHLHLADDEAFRLALSSVPGLQPTASSRGLGQLQGPNMLMQNNLDLTNFKQQNYPLANSVYQGSYSADDIKQIVAYANANQISVIPEIDLPGHARAIIKALPQIMVDPNDNSQFVSVQGYSDDVLPVCTYGTDITVGSQFTPTIDTMLKDTASLFNQQTTVYAINNEISVGGDEVSSNAWTNDTSCRNEWQDLSALEKSHLFFQKLAASNSDLVFSGWQQMVQNDDISLGKHLVPASQTGHVWVWNPSTVGVKQAAQLANKNYPVVLAYADKSYFDLAYSNNMYEPGFTWAAPYVDTQSSLSVAATSFETQSDSKLPQNILGVEGTLWSENLASFDHLMYMALPKMPGLAEAAWSPINETYKNKQLNWQSLAMRLGCGQDGFLAYLNKLYGVNYRGYPSGIKQEVPMDSLCATSTAQAGS